MLVMALELAYRLVAVFHPSPGHIGSLVSVPNTP
jgi:hypothetical protein